MWLQRWLLRDWKISYYMLMFRGRFGMFQELKSVSVFQTHPVIISFFFLLRRRETFHQSCRRLCSFHKGFTFLPAHLPQSGPANREDRTESNTSHVCVKHSQAQPDWNALTVRGCAEKCRRIIDTCGTSASAEHWSKQRQIWGQGS